MITHEIEPCPRCGQHFECKPGSIRMCHCSRGDIRLTPEQREWIALTWPDRCLCHDCLLAIKQGLIGPSEHSVATAQMTTSNTNHPTAPLRERTPTLSG
ncbi:MAG TPA: hypothetical protein DD979_03235 [Gammaproteobacteria bacterium]|jgi:hypothetical protein|nr:hypothetical protein [Gammaproteobacteria bacterium]